MARPGDIDSKSVSVRIPMGKYLELLQEAMNQKMSMSELLTYKIFKNETKKIDTEQKVIKSKDSEGTIIFEGSKYDAIIKLYDLKEKFRASRINNLSRGDAFELKNYVVGYYGRNQCTISIK
jgi:hypothetical protein